MNGFRQYTDRVTLQSDGCYCWRQEIDREYELSRLKIGFYACVIIAVFILGFGAVLAVMYDDPFSMLIVAGCTAVFMLISIVVFGISAHFVDTPREGYVMADDYIMTGQGKTSVFFYFKGAKKVTLTLKYIELKGPFRTMRVYVAPEDMSFVRNHILSKVSGDAVIIYS